MSGLFGDEFEITLKKQDVNGLIKKANNVKDEEDNVKKILKSSVISLDERLAIIKQRVLETLGKQTKNVLVIKDRETLHNYISDCIKAGRIAIDTETNNSLDPVTCKLMGPCFYAPGLKQAYVPLNHVDPKTHKRLEWQLTEKDIREELTRILCFRKAIRGGWTPDYEGQSYNEWYQLHVGSQQYPLADYKIIMHNGKFDYEVLKCTCGIAVSPDWDTIIGARILDENEFADAKTSLKYIYTKYIDPSQAKYDIEELFENVQYSLVDPEIFALYAATDSMMTDKVYILEIERFNNPMYASHTRKAGDVTLTIPGLKWVFENIEMPIVTVTAEMELAGVCVDTVFGERLKYKYNEQLTALDNKISAQMNILKPLIKYWKLLPLANRKTKVFQPKKSKLSISKIEEKYPYLDLETGKRYKWGKAKALQIGDEISLSSPTQLAILFYDIFKCPAPSTKKPRGTGEDELIKLSENLKEYADVVNKSLRVIEKDLRASRDEKNEDVLAEGEEDETVTVQDEKKSYEEEAMSLFYDETEQIGEDEEAKEVADTGISVQITKNMTNPEIKTLIEELTPFYIAGAQALQAMCQAIIDRRGIMKLITTYIDVIPDLSKHWPDGRIRFHLNSMGTDTGRYSSGGKLKFFENDKPVVVSGINIQNIPSHNKEIRMLFKAQVFKNTIDVEGGIGFDVPEIAEVETNNGFKFCTDLTSNDKLVFSEGEVVDIQQVKYDPNTKVYTLFTNDSGKLRTQTRYRIIGSDYSAQEPRLTAYMSQDPEMIKAYNEGKDLYAVIAQAMFKNRYEDNLEFYPEGTEIELDGKKIICGKKTHLHKAGKERRAKAKTMLLAILYGMSPKTAGIRMGYNAKEAQKAGQELMDGFFTKFKSVRALMDDSKNDLLEKGYVEDWAGRERRLPDIEYQKTGHLYEAKLKDGDRFNPFLECEDNLEAFPEEQFWNGVIAAYADWSAKDHEKRGESYRKGEMSNKTYEWLARVALNPDKMRNLPRYLGDDATGKKANPKSFDKLYEDCGAYLGCRTKEAFDKIFPKKAVILSAFTGRVAQAERQCLNARIQGGAASLTKLAMVNIFNDEELRRLQARLIITVHDEVLVECPAFYADQVEKRLPQIMIDTAKPFINVPMSCDPYNVSRWYCDEAAVSVREEFKKLESGNKDKGIPPMSREDALEAVFKKHPELPESCIINTIEQGSDLEF